MCGISSTVKLKMNALSPRSHPTKGNRQTFSDKLVRVFMKQTPMTSKLCKILFTFQKVENEIHVIIFMGLDLGVHVSSWGLCLI